MGGTARRPSTPSAETPGRLLTRRETAEYLALPERTLAAWAYRGTGPRFFKVGRWTRYRVEDLNDWLAGCVVENWAPSVNEEEPCANRKSGNQVRPSGHFGGRPSA